MATDGGNESLLAYPRGMPDSLRMREGEVDASRLVRLPDDRVKGKAYALSKVVSRIARNLTSTGRKLELLASYEPSLPSCTEPKPDENPGKGGSEPGDTGDKAVFE